MSTQIKPSVFNFESDCQVRAIIIDGAPWFVAMDVCRAIGIANHRDAVRKLDSDEKGVGSTDTLGGEQETTIISESGLYTLILRCRDAVTPGTIPYRFRKWVTGEVLPQIRKTGSYIKNAIQQEDRIKIVADQVANATALAVMQTMQIEQKNYSAPLKPNYREHIHSPEGVLGLTEHSLMMNLLRQLDSDGHDVEGAVAEFTAMVSYIVGASKCLRDIRTHAQYINSMAGKF
ncbi:Bro-N domain-containing protein [Citrobacter freundii]|nr:Bro-N domain-containing protein [Citrobacter freundii]